jgi:hypothetical protein
MPAKHKRSDLMSRAAAQPIAAPAVADTTTRVNIVLSEKARTELEYIATRTRRSMTEVIRIALALLKVAFDESEKGNKLAVVDANGKPVKEIVMAG